MIKILLLDNYDSFTYNLYDYLLQLGADCCVVRNDALTLAAIKSLDFDGILLSPGPKKPKDAGILMEVIDFFHDKKPLLGVCLGHQGIGEFFGAKLHKAILPMHGKTSDIRHTENGIFDGLPNPLRVMRYHSLVIDLPRNDVLIATAKTAEGEIMAFQHRQLPIHAVQFHPESILTESGLTLLENWLKLVQQN